jgi:hypothetical protein
MKINRALAVSAVLMVLVVGLRGSPPPSGHRIGFGQFLGSFTGNGWDGKYSVSNMQNISSDSLPSTWHPVTDHKGNPEVVLVLKTNSVGRLTGTLKMRIFTGYHLDDTHSISVSGTFIEVGRTADYGKINFSYKFQIVDTDGIYYSQVGDIGSGEWKGTLDVDWNPQQPFPTKIKAGPGSSWEANITSGSPP